MKMELYCPARSLAGHDKNQYFIIVSDEGEYVAMAKWNHPQGGRPEAEKQETYSGREDAALYGASTDKEIRDELNAWVERHGAI